MAYVKKYAKKAPSKRPVRRYARKSYPKRTPAKGLKMAIENVLVRKAETKQPNISPLQYTFNGNGTNNSIMSSPVDITSVISSMSQGTANGQRIGNDINVTKALLNINMTASSGQALPYLVTIFVGYVKGSRTTSPSASNLASILDLGGSTSGYTGMTQDLLLKLNTDKFSCIRKNYKIGLSAPSSGLGYQNNDFPVFQNIKIPIKALLGKIQYNSDSSSGINRPVYMWAQFTAVNSLPQAISVAPTIFYYLDVEYKDM